MRYTESTEVRRGTQGWEMQSISRMQRSQSRAEKRGESRARTAWLHFFPLHCSVAVFRLLASAVSAFALLTLVASPCSSAPLRALCVRFRVFRFDRHAPHTPATPVARGRAVAGSNGRFHVLPLTAVVILQRAGVAKSSSSSRMALSCCSIRSSSVPTRRPRTSTMISARPARRPCGPLPETLPGRQLLTSAGSTNRCGPLPNRSLPLKLLMKLNECDATFLCVLCAVSWPPRDCGGTRRVTHPQHTPITVAAGGRRDHRDRSRCGFARDIVAHLVTTPSPSLAAGPGRRSGA